MGSEKKPDVVVQVVVLAQDNSIKAKLQAYDIHVQTVAEVAPIEVQPARVLSKLYAHLGKIYSWEFSRNLKKESLINFKSYSSLEKVKTKIPN